MLNIQIGRISAFQSEECELHQCPNLFFLLYVVQDFLHAHHTLLRYAQPFFQFMSKIIL